MNDRTKTRIEMIDRVQHLMVMHSKKRVQTLIFSLLAAACAVGVALVLFTSGGAASPHFMAVIGAFLFPVMMFGAIGSRFAAQGVRSEFNSMLAQVRQVVAHDK